MPSSLNNHVRERGSLPEVKITNWGSYVAFELKVGDHTSTSFLHPLEDESIGKFISRIRAQFVNIECQVIEDPKVYA